MPNRFPFFQSITCLVASLLSYGTLAQNVSGSDFQWTMAARIFDTGNLDKKEWVGWEEKGALSCGFQLGTQYRWSPKIAVFGGLGWMNYRWRVVSKAQELLREFPNDPDVQAMVRDPLETVYSCQILEIPLRVELFSREEMKGFVFGYGFSPSLLLSERFVETGGEKPGKSGSVATGSDVFFLGNELHAGYALGLGNRFCLDARLFSLFDFVRLENSPFRRFGLGFQVLLRYK